LDRRSGSYTHNLTEICTRGVQSPREARSRCTEGDRVGNSHPYDKGRHNEAGAYSNYQRTCSSTTRGRGPHPNCEDPRSCRWKHNPAWRFRPGHPWDAGWHPTQAAREPPATQQDFRRWVEAESGHRVIVILRPLRTHLFYDLLPEISSITHITFPIFMLFAVIRLLLYVRPIDVVYVTRDLRRSVNYRVTSDSPS